MEQGTSNKEYDVIIAGAGPAGCACALSLKDAGLRVALFDKQNFPRDKVCGDAIPGRAIQVLKNIFPEYEDAFRQFPKKYLIRKTQLHYNGRVLERAWLKDAYTCTRMDFDNFLLTLVKGAKTIDVFTGATIKEVNVNPDGVTVKDVVGKLSYSSSVIVGCDGAQSVVAKNLAGKKLDRKHTVASVRAYYSNVVLTETDRNEVFVNKDFFPGYFWIFPLPGNMVNAGFGMLASDIALKKINIKEAFYEFITHTPALSVKFAHAKQAGDLEGFGLPLGSKRITVAGDRFLLTGDAASLIDPVSGAGIDNAMLSGKMAAEQVIRSFQKNDFSSDHMKQYETALFNTIGKGLRNNSRILRLGSKWPFLLDVAFWMGKKN